MDAAAVTAVAPGQLLHSLRRLVNSSWLAVRHDPDQSAYQMLDTLREYAAERLADAGGRILLGTDFPNIPYSYVHQLQALDRLDLGEPWLRAVCHDNAVALLGL